MFFFLFFTKDLIHFTSTQMKTDITEEEETEPVLAVFHQSGRVSGEGRGFPWVQNMSSSGRNLDRKKKCEEIYMGFNASDYGCVEYLNINKRYEFLFLASSNL